MGYFDGAASTQRDVSSVEQQTCRDSSEDQEPAASRRFSSIAPATNTDTDADTSATASLPHQQIYAEPMPQRVVNYDAVLGLDPSPGAYSPAARGSLDYGSMPTITPYGSMPEKENN